ncbi:MAG: FHA domain-containing protein [Bacteroidota bacterium]
MQSKTIGSSSGNDIVLNGRYVAPNHAVLTMNNDRIFIEDLESTFGTYVNGKPIEKITELDTADRVKVGTSLLNWKDAFYPKAESQHPIYIKDLFWPAGLIDPKDYRFTLLLVLCVVILIPLTGPVSLLWIIHRFELADWAEESGFDPIYTGKIINYGLGLVALYIFLNLTQKAVRAYLKHKHAKS